LEEGKPLAGLPLFFPTPPPTPGEKALPKNAAGLGIPAGTGVMLKGEEKLAVSGN
jgi:hypothetical protein